MYQSFVGSKMNKQTPFGLCCWNTNTTEATNNTLGGSNNARTPKQHLHTARWGTHHFWKHSTQNTTIPTCNQSQTQHQPPHTTSKPNKQKGSARSFFKLKHQTHQHLTTDDQELWLCSGVVRVVPIVRWFQNEQTNTFGLCCWNTNTTEATINTLGGSNNARNTKATLTCCSVGDTPFLETQHPKHDDTDMQPSRTQHQPPHTTSKPNKQKGQHVLSSN